MEKISLYITIVLLIFLNKSYCQNSKNFEIICDIESYSNIAASNILERYNYTIDSIDSLRLVLQNSMKYVLSKHTHDALKTTSIPVFKLNKNIKVNAKNNVLNFIEFKNDLYNQKINVYNEDKIVGDFIYLDKKFRKNDMALFFYALIGDNFDYPIRENSLHGFLMKLGLEKKYFAFFIDQLKDVLFILKDNKIYAITNPDENGNYEEDEINYFFSKKITCEQIKKLNQGKSFVYHKNKKENKSNNYYKEDYIVTIKKD